MISSPFKKALSLILCISLFPSFAFASVFCEGSPNFPNQPFEDINSDGCFDDTADVLNIKAALESGSLYTGLSGAGLVIPKSSTISCASGTTCQWQFDGLVHIAGKVLGVNSSYQIHSNFEQSISGSLKIKGGTIALSSQGDIVANTNAKLNTSGDLTVTSSNGSCIFNDKVQLKSSAGNVVVNCAGVVSLARSAFLDGFLNVEVTSGNVGTGNISFGDKAKVYARKKDTSTISITSSNGNCITGESFRAQASSSIELNCAGSIETERASLFQTKANAATISITSVTSSVTLGLLSSFVMAGQNPAMTVHAAGNIVTNATKMTGADFSYQSDTGDITISSGMRFKKPNDLSNSFIAPFGTCDTSALRILSKGASDAFYNCQAVIN